jgi:hypothetical protein
VTLDEVFERLVVALKASATPFAFIGALGAMAWGRPRATTDLDLVVLCDGPGFSTLSEALARAGFQRGAGVGPADASDPLPEQTLQKG